jgi:hypothetical protein
MSKRIGSALAVIFFVAVHPSISANAQSSGPTADQLNRMSEEEINKLPAIPTMATMLAETLGKGRSPATTQRLVITTLIEDQLYTLRYYPHLPTGEMSAALSDAIKAFQRQTGSAPTGVLLMGEFEQLQRSADKYSSTKMQIIPLAGNAGGGGPQVTKTGNVVLAEGAWVSDVELAYKINASKIYCYKDQGICEEHIAQLVPDINNPDGNTVYLQADEQRYKILKWDDRQVVAEELVPSGCRIVTITINLVSKEVDEVDRNGTAKGCNLVIGQIPNLDKPVVSRLVHGLSAVRPYYAKRQEEGRKMLDPAYTQVMKRIGDGAKQ